jgi:hypothetical protein
MRNHVLRLCYHVERYLTSKASSIDWNMNHDSGLRCPDRCPRLPKTSHCVPALHRVENASQVEAASFGLLRARVRSARPRSC